GPPARRRPASAAPVLTDACSFPLSLVVGRALRRRTAAYEPCIRRGTFCTAFPGRLFAISRKAPARARRALPLLGLLRCGMEKGVPRSTKVVPRLLHCVTVHASNCGRQRPRNGRGRTMIPRRESHVRPVSRQAGVRRAGAHQQGRLPASVPRVDREPGGVLGKGGRASGLVP